jgi:dUTP pyrophosphatase
MGTPHVSVKIKKLYDDVELPKYINSEDIGMDVYSREDHLLKPGEQHHFKLGFSLAPPPGIGVLVWDRSGLAARQGITVLGGAIEHVYRGEYGVVLMNVSNTPYEIKVGDRIAQLVFQPVLLADLHVVEELDETQRALNGFGSSGR